MMHICDIFIGAVGQGIIPDNKPSKTVGALAPEGCFYGITLSNSNCIGEIR
jgi:hypothetical protein